MLPIQSTGLLSTSPATKTQQPQYKNNMSALKPLGKDSTTFTSLPSDIEEEVVNEYLNTQHLVGFLKEKVAKKDVEEIYGEVVAKLEELGARKGIIKWIKESKEKRLQS